ncbi:hypothetical protein NUU61_007328 [Penicillium alfredii]|uniref:N-acetyltransferase domain-containing protein n=1 Tax=Penicillium alfredii TaxID=1506179 RepID=A0A9W9K457_9EURO|nr:uncharacterized protein NUU61_007328 [Penicillium alfredii]KAJ5092458.1 hypothetical protein NUU61_007328 [Penicillium alfredii]
MSEYIFNMSSKPKVSLIPWDAESDGHIKALTSQREECRWHQEKVGVEWKEQQLKGEKCIYWIVIPTDDSEQREIKAHLDPAKGNEELSDTATSINGVPRNATRQTFIPVGHISLDPKNSDADKLELNLPPANVLWIKSFFVSHSFQGQGIGRAAMDEVEDMATQPPLSAKTLMLDTVQKDDQVSLGFAEEFFGDTSKVVNEAWYRRRGYELIKTVQNYYRVADKTGKVWDAKTVFMRKDIS